MVLHQQGCLAPHTAAVFKLAHQFLFLGIHADDRITAASKLLPIMVEPSELLVVNLKDLSWTVRKPHEEVPNPFVETELQFWRRLRVRDDRPQ